MDVRVTGAKELLALRKRLKEAGDKDLWKEFTKEVGATGKPIIKDVKAHALESLPRSGGLAEEIARRTRYSTKVKTSPKHPSIRIEARADHNLRRINQGRLRHPVFASQDRPREQWTWVTQSVEPGWFDGPIEDKADQIRKAALAALRNTATKVEKKR